MNNFNNNIDINRFHLRTNVIFKLTSSTTLDTRIQGRFEKFNGPHKSANDIFGMVMDANPVDFPSVYEPDLANKYVKHILFGSAILNGNDIKSNPYAEMVRGYETRDANTISAQATLMQDLGFVTEGLSAQVKASASTDSYYSGVRTYTPFFYALESYNDITGDYKLYNLNPSNPSDKLGGVVGKRDGTTKYYFEARVNWDSKFGKHSVALMTVGTAEENLLTGGNSGDIYLRNPAGKKPRQFGTRFIRLRFALFLRIFVWIQRFRKVYRRETLWIFPLFWRRMDCVERKVLGVAERRRQSVEIQIYLGKSW